MRSAVAGFWLGAVCTAALFAAAGGTAVTVRVTATDTGHAQLEQEVDQNPLATLLAPAAPPVGALHIRKRNWGIITTYAQTLAAPGARAAGVPDVRVLLTLPGAVTATNADGREGRALVWTGLPAAEPAWAEARAINWPVAALAAAAAAVSLWVRGKAG